MTGGLNDPRVQYWEPAKWVAKLRATKTDDHLLVLQDGDGRRALRPVGPLRRVARRGVRAGVRARPDSGSRTMSQRDRTHVVTTQRRTRARRRSCAIADGAPRAAMVLCHPHPQYGGTMRSIVIGDAVRVRSRTSGVTCLRFNFRGVEGSERRVRTTGTASSTTLVAAVATLGRPRRRRRRAADPRGLVVRRRHGAHHRRRSRSPRGSAIAPPLRILARLLGGGARSAPQAARARRARRVPRAVVGDRRGRSDWVATTHEVVPGASHFFVGRTDRAGREIAAALRGRGGQPVVTGVATWRSRNAARRSMADFQVARSAS